MEDISQVGEARRFALTLSTYLQFDDVQQGRVSIVVNELGNNLVKYAKGGQLLFRILSDPENYGIEVLSIDRGPGFESTSRVLTDGFTTGSTPGTGLGAVARLACVFDIFSLEDKGTVVVALMFADPEDLPHEQYVVGAVNVPIRGEILCGDAWLVIQEGETLSALVVDGLGHGPQANEAALQATKVFKELAGRPLDQLITGVHNRLRSTRGAAVSLIDSRDGQSLAFLGVGNIRSIIIEHAVIRNMISQNGTAGIQMRTAQVRRQEWERGGVIVMHSDGIHTRWDLNQYPGLLVRHPSLIAATIFRDFTRASDDTTVLVIARAH